MAKKKIALALQGGGAHGAYTWGVLDRLFEEDELEIEAIVGTSAGAMNAAVTAYGLIEGGKDKARELLEDFWKRIAARGRYSMLQPSWYDKLYGDGGLDYSPGFNMFSRMVNMLSPYEFNPLNVNPLKEVCEEVIDFDKLRKTKKLELFVCATNVRTNRAKVFHTHEISSDALMASACLPEIYQAVEIEGEAYWDGGFMGNPPLFPLVYETSTEDILLIKVNPINSANIPKTVKDIEDRMNEISFNSALMWEMRWIDFRNRLIERGKDPDHEYRKINIHAISADRALVHLGYSSKLNTSWEFLQKLHDLGRTFASMWVRDNLQHVGVRSSCDVRKEFL